MTCKHAEIHLSAFVDGELTGETLLGLRKHLAECEDCSARAGALIELKSVLGTLEPVEPDAEFEGRLLRAVFGENHVAASAKPRLRPMHWVAAAACVGLAVALSWRFFAQSQVQPEFTLPHQDFNARVTRDQAYLAGSDPLMGNSVVPVTMSSR